MKIKKSAIIAFLIFIISSAALPLHNSKKQGFIGNDISLLPGPYRYFRKTLNIKLNGKPGNFTTTHAGLLFLSTDKGYLYAFNMQPSFLKWVKKFRSSKLSHPFILENNLYIINEKINLYKIHIQSGAVLQHFKLKKEVHSCLGIYNEHIYCMAEDGDILRINKLYGKISSSHSTDIEPAVYGLQEKNTIYIPAKNERLVAYDMKDMRVLFTTETEHDMISPPVIGGEKIYILGRTKLYAISKVTGNIEWVRRFNIRWINDAIPVPRIYKGRVFLGIRGFDIKTGLGNWIVYGRGKKLTDSYIAGNYLYYGGRLISAKRGKKGFIQIIDIEKKERKAFIYLDEIPNTGLKIYNRTLIFVSKAGYLVCYSGS